MSVDEKSVIISIDFGSSCLKTKANKIDGTTLMTTQIPIEYLPTNDIGTYEINPIYAWNLVKSNIQSLIDGLNLTSKNVASVAIVVHRGSFLLWDRVSGVPECNILSWRDKRAENTVDRWNNSCLLWIFRLFSNMMTRITGSPIHRLNSQFNFKSVHTSIRLHWLLQNNKRLSKAANRGEVLFGTLDTWLLWNLTEGSLHVTDVSNASSSGMFHIYKGCWEKKLLRVLNIPESILPKVVGTCGQIGVSHESIFGSPINISCVIADQQASSVGCFSVPTIGSTKLTLGTGAYIDIHCGSIPLPILESNIYPLIAFTQENKTFFLMESCYPNFKEAIQSLMDENFLLDYNSFISTSQILYQNYLNCDLDLITDQVLKSVAISLQSLAIKIASLWSRLCEKIFIFSLETRHEKFLKRPTSFYPMFAINRNSRRFNTEFNHMEHILFSENHLSTLYTKPTFIKVEGGFSRNDFLVQCICDLINIPMHRLKDFNSSVNGAAMLAVNTLKAQQQLNSILEDSDNTADIEKIFYPASYCNSKKGCINCTTHIKNSEKLYEQFRRLE